jgi:hypothetical protein
LKSEEDVRNYIRKRNEVKRIVNAEKNKIWDRKCIEINIYIYRKMKYRGTKIHKKYNNREKREKREREKRETNSDNIT